MDFGMRTIADRVIVRLNAGETMWIVEMTLDEARMTRTVLDRAIDRLESGASVAHDFESFLHSIPGHEAV